MAMIDSAGAGDIVSFAGFSNPSIGHTVANVEVNSNNFSLIKIIL